jgi:hypothetical protein
MSDAPLKLSAADAEDLQVIAAICQDALVPVGEMAFLQDEKRFVLALNRFRWDQAPEGEAAQRRRRQDYARPSGPGRQRPGL